MFGIVGYGNLGKAVAKAARDALGMRVLVAARPGSQPGREADTPTSIGPVRVTLDELLRLKTGQTVKGVGEPRKLLPLGSRRDNHFLAGCIRAIEAAARQTGFALDLRL